MATWESQRFGAKLDGGPWIQAVGTLDWTTVISLTNQGQNTLSAYAVDPNGKFSDTNSVLFLYAPVVLQVSGQGTISPAYQSQSIVVGKHYTVTAKPANGCIFVDWTDNAGNIRATTAKYSFTMTTGLELQANFIPNPFLSLAGTYAGLFGDTNTFSPANAGYFSAALTGQGGLTAQLQLAGGAYRFSGPFSPYGAYSNSAVAGPGGEPLTVQLQLDLSGSQGLTGSVSSATWKAGLAAYRAAYSLTNTGPLAGKNYTLMIPEAADASTGPSGYGFGTLSVSASGGITFSITLGDGSKVTAGSSVVVGPGQWPLYLSPPAYAGKGLAWGWLSFAASSTDQTVGSLNWLKQAGLPGKLYPNGFAFSGAAGDGVALLLHQRRASAELDRWARADRLVLGPDQCGDAGGEQQAERDQQAEPDADDRLGSVPGRRAGAGEQERHFGQRGAAPRGQRRLRFVPGHFQ